MLLIPKFILHPTKNSKTGKIHCFFLKNWVSIFIPVQLLLSLNNIKKKVHNNMPEMFNFNLKTSIRKYPIFCSCYNFFCANVSDFYTHFNIKYFELSYLYGKLSYTNAL